MSYDDMLRTMGFRIVGDKAAAEAEAAASAPVVPEDQGLPKQPKQPLRITANMVRQAKAARAIATIQRNARKPKSTMMPSSYRARSLPKNQFAFL